MFWFTLILLTWFVSIFNMSAINLSAYVTYAESLECDELKIKKADVENIIVKL